jgi:hypothetical protein
LSAAAAEIIVGFATVARQKAAAGLLTQPPSLRQLFALADAVRKGLPLDVAFRECSRQQVPQRLRPGVARLFRGNFDEASFKQALVG